MRPTVLALFLFSLASLAQDRIGIVPATRILPAPAFSADALVALPASEWPTHGGNLFNQRYSQLAQIDGGNVAELKGVWQTPAVDPGLGLVYFATANPGPDYTGGIRPGDNLYSSSIVAVDAYTGAYRWHFQQVHHDIWDYDASNPVLLFDVEIDGEPRRGIVEVGKTGFAYFLDRETGEPLIGRG